MRIAIIGRGIPTLRYPLNGIFEWDQARALALTGIKIDYLAVDLRSFRRLRPWGIIHGEKDGVTYHCISIPLGRLSLQFRVRIGIWALERLFQNVFSHGNPPNILHAHFHDIGYMVAKLSKIVHIPFVVTEHSSDILEQNISEKVMDILRESHAYAARVIAVSNVLKKSIYQHTGIETVIIPNIVSSEFSFHRVPHRSFVFVSTGVLEEGKRHRFIIKAFAKLVAFYDNVQLGIIGDGPLRKDLQELADKLHVSDKVKFYGTRLREEIATIYSSCDCFVLPSAFETFGVSYIEAMAAGLPVIATRCGGPEDFVNEDNGILVPIDDAEALARAMEYMYKNGSLFSGERISDYAQKNFSGGMVAKRLMHIYKEVAKFI